MDKKSSHRNASFRQLHREYGLTENGLRTIANKHRIASGRNSIGAHEAQCIGQTVYRALERYLFKKGGKPRFKSFRRGISTVSGTDNHDIIWKAEKQRLYWRKHLYQAIVPKTPYYEEALAHRVKYCRIVRRTMKGKYRWFVQFGLRRIASRSSCLRSQM